MYSIIIPVYNEEKNIQILYNEILKASEINEYEIIFVNDCSSDSSLSMIKNIIKSNTHTSFINLKQRTGQSFAIYSGIKKAKNNTIVTIDCDLQNDPKDIEKLITIFKSNNYGLVGGIRANRKDNLIKKISSILANKVRAWILKDGCKDTGCSLKVFKKNIFLKMPFFDGIHRFLPALFKAYNEELFFCNVSHRERIYGKSNYGITNRLFKGIKDIIRVKKIIRSLK